jgi:CDP-diacylglycerol--serine O-phosphatidyltransferase
MNIKAQIPNLFTMLNLFCGCLALVMAIDLKFDMAFYFVCLGIFFDFFDGFFARKFGVAGPLGVQLDSLADMVTSGVVPGFVMWCLFSNKNYSTFNYLPYVGFIITLGACYRLAKFNIDERQSDSFIGLPTPANALFITSLPLIIVNFSNTIVAEYLSNYWVLLTVTFLSTYIMNAEIPLFSLKIKDFSFDTWIDEVTMQPVLMMKIELVPTMSIHLSNNSILNNLLPSSVEEDILREEISEIFNQHAFEFNDEETRKSIISKIKFRLPLIDIEDRTSNEDIDNTRFNFVVIKGGEEMALNEYIESIGKEGRFK